MRNVQNLIYPGLKLWRLLAIPIVSIFPFLTTLYDESCLIENPYFFVSDMECWPCENVVSVLNLTNFTNITSYQSAIPYIIKTEQKLVSVSMLRHIYESNKQIFDKHAPYIQFNERSQHISTLSKLKNQLHNHYHLKWRINRMEPARVIRKLFPKPSILSKWASQSLERFLFIDGAQSLSYKLPDPECSFVFLIQGSGERVISLKPSHECRRSCRTVHVQLKPSYVLFYNWWYWRPTSFPDVNVTKSSITLMTSFC